jgi:hypothetical protein
MDLLRINEQEGQFLKNGVWIPICDIERDDLLELIRATASNDHVGLVECNGGTPIRDPISMTIYEQVYKVLNDLDANRATYLASIDEEFDRLEREYGLT